MNVHKSRMYTNQDIHMRVWDHMKCIPTGLPNLKECPPGHIIHPGIVSSGHSVSGHSVTRGIVSLRGNVSPGAYCPSRRMSPGHSVSGACRLGPSHLSTKKSFMVQILSHTDTNDTDTRMMIHTNADTAKKSIPILIPRVSNLLSTKKGFAKLQT